MVDIRTEFQIDGGWSDVSGDVLNRDPMTIIRGRRDESSRFEPSKLTFTLNNRDGLYSLHNPRSPLYGKLTRNTPVRVSVPGETYYRQPDHNRSWLSTPSGAHLDVATDIDVRLEFTPEVLPVWRDGDTQHSCLMARYNATGTPGNRSWRLMLTDSGNLDFTWSTTGDDFIERASTSPVPYSAGQRFAVRATLDVDNGSGGHTVTFYTATSLAGPWEVLGDPITVSGTTSVYSPNDASLEVGAVNTIIFDATPGEYHAAELRDGIDGPLLANPVLANQSTGVTSFTDAQGNLWSLAGGGEISDRHYRFHGEVSEWPTVWGTGGTDMHVPITAAGTTRRITQSSKSAPSALRRYVPTTGIVGYWPMEEPEGATSTTGVTANGSYSNMGIEASGLSFGSNNSLDGSDPLPTVEGHAIVHGIVPEYSDTGWTLSMVVRASTVPSTAKWLMKGIVAAPGYSWVRLLVGQDKIRLEVADESQGPEIVAAHESTNEAMMETLKEEWVHLVMWSTRHEGSTHIGVGWQGVGSGTWWFLYTTLPTEQDDRLTAWRMNLSPDWNGLSFGHIAVYPFGGYWNTDITPNGPSPEAITVPLGASRGFSGEYAGYRLLRLAEESGVSLSLRGYPGETERLGPQPSGSFMASIEDPAGVDGGILYEDRDALRIRYRTRATLYGQIPVVTIPYGGAVTAPPLLPIDDDQATRNDVTASSPKGGIGRAIEETGPMSVQPPPLGVGPYDESVSVNVWQASQLYPIAGHMVALGTVAKPRFPSVTLRLHADTGLSPVVERVNVGDRIDIAGMPEWTPDDTVSLLVNGYTERLTLTTWEIELNCSPYDPWESSEADGDARRVDTEGSVLNASVGDTDTELVVYSGDDLPWITSTAATESYADEFPFTVQSEGEHMEVSAITPIAFDSFSRTAASGLWGASDSGLTWDYSGGLATDYRLTGTAGAVDVVSDSVIRFAWLPRAVEDCSVLMSVTPTQVASGAEILTGPIIRLSGSKFYWFVVSFNQFGRVVLQIANGTTVVIPSVASRFEYSAGQEFWVRAEVRGNHVRGRVWPNGVPEPAEWMAEGDITTNTSPVGYAGLLSYQSTAGTNVGAELHFGEFEVQNPQLFTVTRGVNGIAKSHPLAAPIALADPATVTL